MYRLIALNGKLRGQRIAVRAAVIIAGGDAGCDVQLEGGGVAARHARFQEYNGIVTVSALEAGAVVKVNGVSEIARRLDTGDRLALGEFEFEFQPGAGANAADPPKRRPVPLVFWSIILALILAQIAVLISLDRLYRATVGAFEDSPLPPDPPGAGNAAPPPASAR